MADYNNTRDSSLPDPASPGFRDGDTITLQNGSKFSRQAGRWEPVRFQTVGQQSKEMPLFTTPSSGGVPKIMAGDVDITDQIGGGYALADADIAARPPRLYPVDSLPCRLFNYADSLGLIFGHTLDNRQICAVNPVTRSVTTGYQFPPGQTINDIFAGFGCALVVVYTIATDTYTLYRTTDGQTVTAVHDIGRTLDGATHQPGCKILQRGMERGKIGGRDAILMSIYNIGDARTTGGANDEIYLAASYDDGRTWERVGTWNNNGSRQILHFHVVRYDKWRDCWWVGTGDSDAESNWFRWDGKTAWPNNTAPLSFPSNAGFLVGPGAQISRTVDFLVTQDWVYTFCDTTGYEIGGIWRMRPDGTQKHRVNGDVNGSSHEGWSALYTSGGTMLWCDDVGANATANGQKYFGIYGSQTGDRFYTIGRIATTGSGVLLMRGFFEADGKVWISASGEAGKGLYSTTVYELKGLFREERPDNLAPAYYVDPVNGNDAADGYGRATAWKTVRNALSGNRITHGARIVMLAGTSTENGVNAIDYAANATPATDTIRHVQISGQGKTASIIAISGAISGWRDASPSKTWDIELCDLTLKQTDATKIILLDTASPTTPPTWTLRDAAIGDESVGSSYATYLQSATLNIIRSDVLQIADSSKYALWASGTATIKARSSRIYGGRNQQQSGAKIELRHCEVDKFANTGILIASGSTVVPYIANSIIGANTGQTPISNASALTIDGSAIVNTAVIKAAIGVTGPVIAPLDRDPVTLTPFAWSSLGGVATGVGVSWDYYGKPMRAKPAIGAVEVQ